MDEVTLNLRVVEVLEPIPAVVGRKVEKHPGQWASPSLSHLGAV